MTVATATPIYIGRDNAEAVVGRPWRWCLDTAAELGVPVHRIGRVALIPAEQLRVAIERNSATTSIAVADEFDELAALRARLGKRRRSA